MTASAPPPPPSFPSTAPPPAETLPGGGPVDTEWSRLHPLSPVVRAGSAVAVLVLFSTQFDTGRHHSAVPWESLVLLGLGVTAGVVSWLVTRWRVHGGDLQIETGLIRRQSIRVPLSRIQAIDVIAPVIARVLGLAEVRVVVAGRGTGRTRLAYLGTADAQRVRARLLALAHGLAPETPEPPAQPLLQVDNLRVAFATALTAPVNVLIGIVILSIAFAAISRGEATAAVGVPALVGVLPELFRRFNAVYDFQLSEAADGFRLSRGLLQTRTETIPFGRIQAVRWVQPLLWRPFGWCRLEVDVARQRGSQQRDEGSAQLSRTLLPLGSREHAAWLLQRVLPGASPVPPPGARPPRRAVFRAPFSYHLLAFWEDRGLHAYSRTGRVRPEVVVVPLQKVQSVRLRQGPWQRALRLSTVHVDTAGRGWQARAECRDAVDAELLVEDLTERARAARKRVR
ncbi:MAG: PH domain-containing protein [Candidatus Dormibacteraeota bacterium]|nr:PH domain-containing protein [Candidatus Dormibacteraeota bacterium]